MSDSLSDRLADGQTFGRYKIVRMLGEGGMGAVYEAIHLGLKKRIAIKTLLPSISANKEAQTRFLREGEAASRINHPNVVDVTDVGTQDGIPYLVMELLEGETLADLVERQGPLDLSQAVDILLPSIAAVSAGHDQGVIHRDLKPQNVFIARGIFASGVPKILDFGVSKILGDGDAALTGTMAVLGTAAYMSPEQARGAKVVDAASDQYAIGLIFHEMLTGARAHDGESPLEILHRIATGVVPDTRRLRSDLPPEIYAILQRTLAVNPRERFPSLRALGRALLPYASEKARMTYAEGFEDSAADLPTPPPERVAGPRSGAGARRPDSGAKSGGTRLLPSTGGTRPQPAPGDRAISVSTLAPKRARAPLWIALGVVAAGGLVVFVLSRPPSSADEAAGRAAAQAAPPTSPSVELPPAPATQLPPTAQQPPPASPPQAAAPAAGSSSPRAQPGPPATEPPVADESGNARKSAHRVSPPHHPAAPHGPRESSRATKAPSFNQNGVPILD